MAATRKLQGEIERCLKKVSEGVEVFEDIWQKVHNATNANQKEKYEADLKKEIKKLQRLRDQIKSWLASGEVKDKSVLLENRRLIETQMERFKVVERETKTKAYSKEGLGAAQKLDPAQRERDEAIQWLSQSIESLQIQTDQFETEIESLQMCTKKKKLDKDKQERIDRLKTLLDSHNEHVKKLEMVMRLLDNMSVTVDQVNKIKDDVDYYIESSTEPDYQENLYIYDEINFDELNHNALEVGTAGSGFDQDNDGVSGINTGSTPSVSSSSPVPSLSAVGTGSSSNSHHSMNDELGIHSTINEKKRHRSSESEASSKRMGSTTASSATSNSHGGVNSSPSMSASGTPPPSQQNSLHHLQQTSQTTLNNVSSSSSSTTVPQSPLPMAVPPSPAKAPPSSSASVIGSNSTPNNSSSSSGTMTAPPVNGPLPASMIMSMTNHVDGSMTPPPSAPSTPVAALQQQRFTMMNGGSSPIVSSPAVGSVSSLPSSPMVSQPQATPGSAAPSSSAAPPSSTTSGISSNVVRQLFQPPSGAPSSSVAPLSSAMDILSQRLAGHSSANNRNDVTANTNLTGNLIPGLKGPQMDTSVTSSVHGKSEVAPLFGLAKEAVLNAQQQQHQQLLHHQEQQQSTENDKNKGLQMDILSSLMDNVRSGQQNQLLSSRSMTPSSSATSPPMMNLVSSMASALGSSSTVTVTSSGQSSVGNNLPVGLHLGGGPDKASIAAFMAENKLNTLPGASSLVSPTTSQALHQHILPPGVLGSGSQQPPGIMTSSSSTIPSTSSADLMSMGSARLDASSLSSVSSSSGTLSTSVTSTTMPPSAAQVAAAVSGLGVSGSGMSSSVASATSGEARIPPSLAVNPTGPAMLTKENQLQLQLLELAAFRPPLQADGERSRLIPRTPYAGIPPYYPQVVPIACDTMEFFSRLSTETLFFIFYYMEGTKAQYLAAKALKKQSWRFHTRFLMWFQRHEEPKTITDEFEQGAYIYFDFEKWSQRKKEGFTFEYRYLEDRDLS